MSVTTTLRFITFTSFLVFERRDIQTINTLPIPNCWYDNNCNNLGHIFEKDGESENEEEEEGRDHPGRP